MNKPKFIRIFSPLLFLFLFLFIPPSSYAVETTVNDFLLYPSQPYVDTGLDILIGAYLDIHQTGTTPIYVSGSTVPWISPAGDPGCTASTGYTLPGVNCWSLVARIGDGNPFLVGSGFGQYSLQNGRLYLGINHSLPFSGSGSWTIRVIRNQTPPPPPPTAFLQLPWAYQTQNLSFSDAALKINSYFDHEYPLLSSGLQEPTESQETLTNFRGEFKNPRFPYSSHDGYDWGLLAGASLNTPVLAAAAGCAKYKSDCPACGNAIVIDHGNFYQTRYYHLQPVDLITNSTNQCVTVTQGQMIGRVGFSGNVSPGGSTGAHLHFMVVEDKNRDDQFEDNIPDGVTDPFGWQSNDSDPWPAYSFTIAGQTKFGNRSYYLWTQAIPNLSQNLPTNGGFYAFQNLQLTFPAGSVAEPTKLSIISTPLSKVSSTIESVGTGFAITVRNLFGSVITQLNQLLTLHLDFSNEDISRFKPETLTVYSSSDGSNWQPEITTFDWNTKTASAQLSHLSYYTLAGELADSQPPTTTVLFNGSLSNLGSFPIPLVLSLTADDTASGSGIAYTLYKISSADWQQYTAPIVINNAGDYTLQFYSLDNRDNREPLQTATFTITPEASPSPTPLPTPGASPESSPSPTPSSSPTPTPSPTSFLTSSPSPNPTPTATPEPDPTPSPTPTPTPVPTPLPSPTPSPSPSSNPTPTPTPLPSISPNASPSVSPSPSPSPSSSPAPNPLISLLRKYLLFLISLFRK